MVWVLVFFLEKARNFFCSTRRFIFWFETHGMKDGIRKESLQTVFFFCSRLFLGKTLFGVVYQHSFHFWGLSWFGDQMLVTFIFLSIQINQNCPSVKKILCGGALSILFSSVISIKINTAATMALFSLFRIYFVLFRMNRAILCVL